MSVALIYFFVYRNVFSALGAEMIGVWSIVVSLSSVAGVAYLGVQVGLTKFVPLYITPENEHLLPRLFVTSLAIVTVLYGFLIGIIYLFSDRIFALAVSKEYRVLLNSILPYVMGAFFLNAVGSLISSVFDGLQRTAVRAGLTVISFLLFAVVLNYWIPLYGVRGLALAQLTQSLFYFCAAILALLWVCKPMRKYRWKWDSHLFKEVAGFSVQLQLASILILFFEPLTNLFLANLGGIGSVGYYEMGNRLISQIRGLLVQANQVLVPVLSKVVEFDREKFREIYGRVSVFNIEITSLVFFFLVASSGYISILWIGAYSKSFVTAFNVLCLGVYVNLVSTPAYFAATSQGKLMILIISHALISGINLFLCLLADSLRLGGDAIIWIKSLALIAGSVYLMISFERWVKVSPFFQSKHAISFMAFFGFGYVVFELLSMGGLYSIDSLKYFIAIVLIGILAVALLFGRKLQIYSIAELIFKR